ncbi:MAG: TOTE conflict system archaeo-eukaryotic primase domain-containing protein [Acidobacteriaceae bacterium]
MRLAVTASQEIVRAYWRLFVNRRAYTLQSIRPHPETGRHYYFRPKEKGTERPLSLSDTTIRQHLEGEVTVGLYAINPANQRCKWVAIDADYKNAIEDLLKLQYHLTQDKVEPALEMSKRGGHLWIFFATPLLARECRIYVHDLARRLGVPVKGSGLAEGIELFPKHDAIGAGEFGNAIRGPLGIHRGANRRFWFYGADYTLEAQLEYLNALRKVTEAELQAFIVGREKPLAANSEKPASDKPRFRAPAATRREFRILEHVTAVRKIGRNYVARCPSCAESGHDRSGDNLAILIQDPRYYKCWAGCTKEMIRAALGQPICGRSSA